MDIKQIVLDLCSLSDEQEWFEFKENWFQPEVLGEYVSALSNAAAFHYKKNSLNEGKSLSKNGSPVTFLIEKTDDDYSLFFFINRIKGKIIIDYHKTNAPACQYRIIYQTELLWQVG